MTRFAAIMAMGTTAAGVIGDGDPISTWHDRSGNANDATQSGSARPIYKTNIVNSLPVVRFASASSQILNLDSSITGVHPWVVLAVMKPTSVNNVVPSIGDNVACLGPYLNSDGNMYVLSHGGTNVNAMPSHAFHVYTGGTQAESGSPPYIYIDGTFTTLASDTNAHTGNFDFIGSASANGDIAEIIIYDAVLSATDRANVEKYLGTKYSITVAGGTAAQPDTVTGLVGWWKADDI